MPYKFIGSQFFLENSQHDNAFYNESLEHEHFYRGRGIPDFAGVNFVHRFFFAADITCLCNYHDISKCLDVEDQIANIWSSYRENRVIKKHSSSSISNVLCDDFKIQEKVK